MKHKRRRAGPSPLGEYRRLQREIRLIFDPFTARHCPTCATPCCIQPTRVTPVAVSYAGSRLTAPLALPMIAGDGPPLQPCEYLDKGRCTFPDDLRPYGCTAYICGPMYAHLPGDTLRRLRRLIRQLDDAHTALLRGLRDAGKMPTEE